MVRVQAQFTPEQAAQLRELATERETTVAALIREGVDRLLSERDTPSWEERKARAREAAGMFASDGSDVARRHDDYLDEVYGDWKR